MIAAFQDLKAKDMVALFDRSLSLGYQRILSTYLLVMPEQLAPADPKSLYKTLCLYTQEFS